MRSTQKLLALGLGLLLLAGITLGCGKAATPASGFPTKAINLIVPFSAGDSSDLSSRPYAEALGAILGQPVVVTNKPGAGGTIGGTEVARAKGDGYTLLTGTYGMLTVTPYMTANIGYTYESFKPIAQIAAIPLAIAVNKDSKLTDVKSLIEYAKANPGKVKYGTPGAGTVQHLTMESFAKQNGIKMINIPFEGGNRAVAALLGGHVDFIVVGATMVAGQAKAGEIRVLGVTGEKRLDMMPEASTFKEQGFDLVAGVWFGVLVPSATPDNIVKTLSDAFKKASEDPKVADALKKAALVPAYMDAQAFGTQMKNEATKNKALVNELGLVKKQ